MRSFAGRFDVALLPVWGWGPSLGPGHMDPLSAARAVAIVRPAIAVPIHWGTFFPVGLEVLRGSALVEPPRVFARHVAELAPEVEVRVLAPGDDLVLGRVAS
jgi:L-ascorbate metabolism protein UlaG (beta-lactamase superfamily)